MTRTILVAGTASHVGKSTVAAGLCRFLSDAGVNPAPYKAQNMSNNARAVPSPEGGYGEVGVSQHVQAQAARVSPTTDMNPVLLKPTGEGTSELVIQGEAIGHFEAGAYYEEHWERARSAAETSHERLAATHDVVVAEGAGSIAEINFHDHDLANVETARFADADILLLVDIERGGAFASLYGTLELMPPDCRERVCGAIITKFRGDRSLLEPGIDEIERRTGVPILGVIPYAEPGLPEEDSVSVPEDRRRVEGDEDGVDEDRTIEIAVPRLPRIANYTDLAPLARVPGVRVVYVPIDQPLGEPAAVVVPGTKNTVDDLLALREAGFDEDLAAFDGPVVGLCGGYQILGERIVDAGVESSYPGSVVEGLGLLPVETEFSAEKAVERVERPIRGVGPLAGASGMVTGYEIHHGRTEPVGPIERPLGGSGAARDGVLGTYLHGLFENENAREAFVDAAYRHADASRPDALPDDRSPFDRTAELVASSVDLDAIDLP